jgi:hypothetical protein
MYLRGESDDAEINVSQIPTGYEFDTLDNVGLNGIAKSRGYLSVLTIDPKWVTSCRCDQGFNAIVTTQSLFREAKHSVNMNVRAKLVDNDKSGPPRMKFFIDTDNAKGHKPNLAGFVSSFVTSLSEYAISSVAPRDTGRTSTSLMTDAFVPYWVFKNKYRNKKAKRSDALLTILFKAIDYNGADTEVPFDMGQFVLAHQSKYQPDRLMVYETSKRTGSPPVLRYDSGAEDDEGEFGKQWSMSHKERNKLVHALNGNG